MRNDPCSTATEYAECMSKATTIVDLKAIGGEIKANLVAITGFEQWLRDWYWSCKYTLEHKDDPMPELKKGAR